MYRVEMKDGSVARVAQFVGGGVMIEDGAAYEVHCDDAEGNFVIDETTGEPFTDFGNYRLDEHPYPPTAPNDD